jgi:hypothetical protein
MPLPDKEIKIYKYRLETCEEHFTQLNDWEKHFIENVSDQFTNSGFLSEKQREVIDQLYDKVKWNHFGERRNERIITMLGGDVSIENVEKNTSQIKHV